MKSGERMPRAWAPTSLLLFGMPLLQQKEKPLLFKAGQFLDTDRSLVCPMGGKTPAPELYPITNTPTPSWESVSHGAREYEGDQAEEQFLLRLLSSQGCQRQILRTARTLCSQMYELLLPHTSPPV